MLTGTQLALQAATDAHQPNATATAQLKLQIILDELCLKGDYALARGDYDFSLNPGLITTVGGITNFGGPYPLPLDYLRTSGSSGSDGVQYAFFYVYLGVPYPLVPWDLGRLDMQVQQAGIQNLPYAYATDVSPETTAQDRIAGQSTVQTTINSTTITFPSAVPSTMLVGMSVSGNGIATGATVVSITTPNVVLSSVSTATFGATSGAGSAAIMWGTPANAYVYPGPSGAFTSRLRYQRLMPPLLDFARIPWFPDQNYLLVRLTADMMASTDDARRESFLSEGRMILGQYDTFADDKTNRAQTVLLDRRRFGRAFNKLPNTKTIGW